MSSDKRLEIYDLGLVEYGTALTLQRELVEKRIGGLVPDMLLLLEHPHVYTLGRKGVMENVINRELPCYRVERGGDATYHGPGQLVAYPIVNLNLLGVGVREFVNILEEACIETLAAYGLEGCRIEGKPGVWVGGRKIASIGLAIRHWVTFHGIAININTDLTYFYGIRPCGMEPETMTSLQQLTGRMVEMGDVKKLFGGRLAGMLGLKPVWLDGGRLEYLKVYKSSTTL
ncbi:Octanoyltransferase [archaeon HR01]|nr:Octanoyltransferase [archaeon HR01]